MFSLHLASAKDQAPTLPRLPPVTEVFSFARYRVSRHRSSEPTFSVLRGRCCGETKTTAPPSSSPRSARRKGMCTGQSLLVE
ncbi:hypothetical protein E2C01_036538 [Portunus trituberculatus]|uniref:Uncharacterized protein n=1 Tax=Portunus trituberculatus TaxID=210409 RepID=A0A5B7FBN2_PORTR|nr:hypothetical protein [Portunus trituberculatus]